MDTPTNPQPSPACDPAQPAVVLSGTAHLLATVPHLLGYQPGRSVVVMASTPEGAGGGAPRPGRSRARIALTARFDLPAAEDAASVVSTLAAPLAQARRVKGGPLLLHVVVYEADDEVAAAVAAAVSVLADEDGHRLQDLALVRDGHYLPLVGGAEEHAGPQAGWCALPAAADVPAVADLVLQGRFPAASREEVAARVRRRDDAAAAQTGLALTLLRMAPETFHAVDALRRLGTWVTSGQDDPAPRERARIVMALADRTLRDAVMARWLPRLFTVEEVLPADLARQVRDAVPQWPAHDQVGALDRLLGLAARVPEPDAVPLLTVTGAAAWGMGEGTVANEAVDRALETDPAYTMAMLLRQALDRGMPPWTRPAAVA